MIAGWWDVPLAHQDLAEAISIIVLKTALTTVYFFNTFYLLEEMKDKCIFIIQNQIIMKTIIWRQVLQNFNVNLKRLLKWFWKVPAWVRLAVLRWISKPEELLMYPQALIFLLIPLFQNLELKVAPPLLSSQKGTDTMGVSDNLMEGLKFKTSKTMLFK